MRRRRWLNLVKNYLNTVGLALLDSSIHNFTKLWTVALNSTASRSQSNERRALTGEDCILTAVDTIHKILDGSRTQADQTTVLLHGTTLLILLSWQIQGKAIILNLVILAPHLLNEITFLKQDVLICDRR